MSWEGNLALARRLSAAEEDSKGAGRGDLPSPLLMSCMRSRQHGIHSLDLIQSEGTLQPLKRTVNLMPACWTPCRHVYIQEALDLLYLFFHWP